MKTHVSVLLVAGLLAVLYALGSHDGEKAKATASTVSVSIKPEKAVEPVKSDPREIHPGWGDSEGYGDYKEFCLHGVRYVGNFGSSSSPTLERNVRGEVVPCHGETEGK